MDKLTKDEFVSSLTAALHVWERGLCHGEHRKVPSLSRKDPDFIANRVFQLISHPDLLADLVKLVQRYEIVETVPATVCAIDPYQEVTS